MTVRELVETVLLRVSGGRLSPDVDVHRNDIFVLLGPMTAFVINQFDTEELQKKMGMARYTGAGLTTSSGLFSSYYKLTPVKDSARGLYYIETPSTILRLSNEGGIDSVRPEKGRNSYTLVKSQEEITGIPDNLGIVFYWVETHGEKHRIYLDGIGSPVCDHIVKLILDPGSLDRDAQITLPAGVDARVIDMLVGHFTGQRLFPQDYLSTDTDEPAALSRTNRQR
jgi:hypothetical protein